MRRHNFKAACFFLLFYFLFFFFFFIIIIIFFIIIIIIIIIFFFFFFLLLLLLPLSLSSSASWSSPSLLACFLGLGGRGARPDDGCWPRRAAFVAELGRARCWKLNVVVVVIIIGTCNSTGSVADRKRPHHPHLPAKMSSSDHSSARAVSLAVPRSS